MPSNAKSYQHKQLASDNPENTTVIPLILFCALRFFSIGIGLIPFTMLAELYPMKLRTVASGLTTATTNIQTFIAIKTFYNLEYWMSLPGAFSVYFVLGVFGLIVTYFILPETEGISLEDIEVHFSDNERSLFDRKIARRVQEPVKNSNERIKNGCTNNAFVLDQKVELKQDAATKP